MYGRVRIDFGRTFTLRFSKYRALSKKLFCQKRSFLDLGERVFESLLCLYITLFSKWAQTLSVFHRKVFDPLTDPHCIRTGSGCS